MLVTEIALEYCVLATCLFGKAYVEEVSTLDNYVIAANPKSRDVEMVNNALENAEIKRINEDKDIIFSVWPFRIVFPLTCYIHIVVFYVHFYSQLSG